MPSLTTATGRFMYPGTLCVTAHQGLLAGGLVPEDAVDNVKRDRDGWGWGAWGKSTKRALHNECRDCETQTQHGLYNTKDFAFKDNGTPYCLCSTEIGNVQLHYMRGYYVLHEDGHIRRP